MGVKIKKFSDNSSDMAKKMLNAIFIRLDKGSFCSVQLFYKFARLFILH